jgi:hypothetical protein
MEWSAAIAVEGHFCWLKNRNVFQKKKRKKKPRRCDVSNYPIANNCLGKKSRGAFVEHVADVVLVFSLLVGST